jgi:hypothetical protein
MQLSAGTVATVLLLALAVDSLGAEESARYWDFNGDGIEDVWYESDDSDLSYIEFTDRNYDTKADQYIQFDGNTDWPVGGFSDDDFDGHYESRFIYKDASLFAILSDSNADEMYDIVHYFESGVVTKSVRYVQGPNHPQIKTVAYDFGYPAGEELMRTDQTPLQFHERLKSEMPQSQLLPTEPSNPPSGERSDLPEHDQA